MKKLNLKKETLVELTTDDLRGVVGGAESASCPITYTCTCISYTSCNVSNDCVDIAVTGKCPIDVGYCG